MSAEGFAVTFVGDTQVPAVVEMLNWLSEEGYDTEALSDALPEVFIPVILDYRIDAFLVRASWPDGYVRPSWCQKSTSVLFFKARAIHCCPRQVRQVVESFEAKFSSANA